MCALTSPFVRVSTAADTQNKCRVFTHTRSDAEGLSDNVKHCFSAVIYMIIKRSEGLNALVRAPSSALVSRRKEFHGHFAPGERLAATKFESFVPLPLLRATLLERKIGRSSEPRTESLSPTSSQNERSAGWSTRIGRSTCGGANLSAIY